MENGFEGKKYTVKTLHDALKRGFVAFGSGVTVKRGLVSPPYSKEYLVPEDTRLTYEVSGILTGIAAVFRDKRGEDEPLVYRLSVGNEILILDKHWEVSVHLPHPLY